MTLEQQILSLCQRDMPLTLQPFYEWAQALSVDEKTLLATLQEMLAKKRLSRVGPVFSPNRIGSSCLAAIAAPDERLAEVAAFVSAHPGVNHNYLREHHFNVWFVLHAADEHSRDDALNHLQESLQLPLIRLPLANAFHIDLGFDMNTGARCLDTVTTEDGPVALSATERQWIKALQSGLPLCSNPYQSIAKATGSDAESVLVAVKQWLASGVIKRVGAVVNHRSYGFVANAMVVFDVPETQVMAAGEWLKAQEGVHLCYQRHRHLPLWPYNLFCMVHGKSREETEARVNALRADRTLSAFDSAVLFSQTAYKQTGAHNLWERACG